MGVTMKIIHDNKIYYQFEYSLEEQLECDIVNNSDAIFGERCIYFDMKKKIGNTIPDGYLIHITEEGEAYLYFVEIELAYHDVYSHIIPQLTKFAVSYENNREKLYSMLLNEIDAEKSCRIRELIADTTYSDERNLLSTLVQNEIGILVIVDNKEETLTKAIEKINCYTEIMEFKKFICGNNVQYYTTSIFDIEEGIEDFMETFDDIEEEYDTIIVSADIEGFEETFLKENCWYTVKMAEYRLENIRYIAAYINRPYYQITHYAMVDKIVPYEDGYKILFKGKPKKIPVIPRGEDTWVMRPRIRYTTYKTFLNSETVTDMFE